MTGEVEVRNSGATVLVWFLIMRGLFFLCFFLPSSFSCSFLLLQGAATHRLMSTFNTSGL